MEENCRNFKDLNPTGIFCVAAFGMQDFFLPNPLKFIWDGFLHRSFGGKKNIGQTSWKLSFESLSSNSCVFPVLHPNAQLKSFLCSKFL
jgi:hypothetical protein